MEENVLSHKKGTTVKVLNNNIEGAITQLKRRMNQEGIMKEMRKRRFYEKPTTRRRREKAEARIRWLRKKATLDPW